MGSLFWTHNCTRFPLQDQLACTYADGKALQKNIVCGLRSRKVTFLKRVKCSTEDPIDGPIQHPQYYTFDDPITGEPGPAYSPNRSNLPDKPFWPADVPGIIRRAGADVPKKTSQRDLAKSSEKAGAGSRRRNAPVKSKSKAKRLETPKPILAEEDEEDVDEFRDEYIKYEDDIPSIEDEFEDNSDEPEQPKKPLSTRTFVEVSKKKEKNVLNPLPNEKLWWNWRKLPPEEEPWNEWCLRPPDSDTVMAAAAAKIGQIKLFGDKPSVAEASLARARRHVLKDERLRMEQERRKEIGSLAYYSEWVKAWKKDTSKEAVRKHFEETGEDESAQLLKMFKHQTREEYRQMMGLDIRIQRDPLTMRMTPEQKSQVWGGDPIYPTVNYYQDPHQKIDYRGPNFHEPQVSIWEKMKKAGRLITPEEIKKLQEEEAVNEVVLGNEFEDAIAGAVDIGEKEEEEEEKDENQDHDEVVDVSKENDLAGTSKDFADTKAQIFKHAEKNEQAAKEAAEEDMERKE